MNPNAAGAFGAVGGLLGLILVIVILALAVCWLVLPFILISKFNQTLKALAAIQQQLELANYQRDKQMRSPDAVQ